MTHIVPRKAAALIAREHMLGEGARVLAAVSGGADSVALLLSLLELGYPAAAFHLNHCLRGAESDRDEQFVRALCERLHVPLLCERAEVRAYAGEQKLGLEEAARRLRYDALSRARAALGCTAIATAHTADDNLETMLFHLARGTGGKGLSGIPPVRRDGVIRPLLACTRAEIEDYLAEKGESYVTDSTNLTDDYTRNRIRHEIVPVLRRINPAVGDAALRLAGLLRSDEQRLARETDALLAKAAEGGEGWSVEAFPGEMRYRMLHRLLEQSGAPMHDIGWKHIDLLAGLLAGENPSAALSLPGRFTARRVYDRLVLEKGGEEGAEALGETRLSVPFSLELRPGVWVRGKTCKKDEVIHKKFNTFCVDCGKIDFESLAIRARRPGDSICLHPNSGTKTLKRLMIEKKIPRDKRNLLAVFADQNGVIAVEGLGSDYSRRASGEMILQLSVEE